jgi:cytochrome bd-type quinol oxidase subunit 2
MHALQTVLIIIKALIFFSAFIYQLLYQLRHHEHFATPALLITYRSIFYPLLSYFFPFIIFPQVAEATSTTFSLQFTN